MKKTINLQIEIPDELFQTFPKNDTEILSKLMKEINPSKSDELLTREEAYKFLKIDSSTLWSHTNKGKLKAYGLGNRIYYLKSELLEALTLKK